MAQRMAALAEGNRIRSYRARVKKDLHKGRVSPRVPFEDPDFASMKVIDLLLHMPGVGRVKANRLLKLAEASPSKTVGGLSPRQRDALLALLPDRPGVKVRVRS